MIETWAVISIAGAFFQNLRSALQKHLKGKLSNSAAAYSRFLYALPFSLLYLALLYYFSEAPLPDLNAQFFIYCVAGSVAQILFTVILLWMFSFKSFAVGTTLSKLEVVVVALLGALLLQDSLSLAALIAIAICAIGVVALTTGQSGITLATFTRQLASRDTFTGLCCAGFLGASVVCFRGASLALQHDDVLISAALTLAITLSMQTVLMGIWISWREIEQWHKLLQQWRWATVVGATGVITSICWFTAITMQNAGFVRSVGTIELLFTYLFSTRIFKEKVSTYELLGMLLIVTGIVLLLMKG